jgi:hypothetical protein
MSQKNGEEKKQNRKQENANPPPPQVAHICPQSRRLREVALWTAMDNLPRPTGEEERASACVVSDGEKNKAAFAKHRRQGYPFILHPFPLPLLGTDLIGEKCAQAFRKNQNPRSAVLSFNELYGS